MAIPFNIAGHTGRKGSDILYWVDASDSGSYSVDGSNNVTQLINKGSAGGVFSVYGSPKYLNGGFESHSASDFITKDLGGTFLPTNSFTMVSVFDYQGTGIQGSVGSWWANIYASVQNRDEHFRLASDSKIYAQNVSSAVNNSNNKAQQLGKSVLISSYDLATNTVNLMNFDGSNITFNSVVFNNTNNAFIWLLNGGVSPTNTFSGANNPLHEFRLYDYPMTQQQMQTLQTQLNNKWI